MKTLFTKAMVIAAVVFFMTSCYTYTMTVGQGAQTGQVVSAKNHYLINGLAAISTAQLSELTGGAQNYEVTVSHSFIDGLLAALTSGIYTPTTVTVKK